MADPFDPDHDTYADPADTGVRTPQPDGGMADEFDPHPLPEASTPSESTPAIEQPSLVSDDDQDWDHGAPDGFWDPPAEDTYMPDLDPIIDVVAARRQIREMFSPPPALTMETVLYPGDIAVDEEGELLPGPYFDPADVGTILSETARYRDHSAPAGQMDDDDTASGGASTGLLIGDDGNDTLSAEEAEYNETPTGRKPVPIIPEWTGTQQSQLRIIGERMPEVLDALATEQGVEHVRRHLPELLAWSERRL